MAKHSTQILEWARAGADQLYRELRARSLVSSSLSAPPCSSTINESEDDVHVVGEATCRQQLVKLRALRMKKYWAERRKAKAKVK